MSRLNEPYRVAGHRRTLPSLRAICSVRVEEIEDPVMQGIRYLDKLIDELAKGRPMEKIIRKGR